MSFQPIDHKLMPASPVESAASPSTETLVTDLALGAAGLAGVNPAALALAGTALQTVTALQAGAGAGALAGGALALAGHANPALGKAMQLAGKAQSLLTRLPDSAAQSPIALIEADAGLDQAMQDAQRSSIAEHPLAGQAANDFASPAPNYTPAAIEPDKIRAAAVPSGSGVAFSEGTRLLRLYCPIQGLLIESLSGTTSLSDQYVFRLALLSKDASIPLKALMGKNVSVGVQLADGSEHFINGYVNAFSFSHSDGGFAFYHAELVPWFTYLKRRVNSRIFQDENVIGVLDKIFKGDHGGLATYEFRTTKTYPPQNYIVQYAESDENFTCRLMEKYGLFYYFEHSASGHVMVITDDSCNSGFCPPQRSHAEVFFNGGNRAQNDDCVTSLSAGREVQSASMALRTFNFKDPNHIQLVQVPTLAVQGDVPPMEVYDGNPAFSFKDKEAGEQEARQRLEVLEWQAKVFSGTSDCRGLLAGHSFKLLEHHWFTEDGANNDLLVLSVSYQARNNYFGHGSKDVYSNSFTAIRREIPYRPRRSHRAPRMPGPQSASVVGPKGTEIHTDQFGRIKVQFHWDRYGRHDELSSCWIRVSQPWAGQGWGTISVPRIGQEVIIDYLEGDPDRPVCTGRLFNADQSVPYELPGAAHMMGFKSRSTPGGGGYCEMVIHDRKGQELVNIHSQKDMVTTVQNNQSNIVNGPQQTNTVSKGFLATKVNKHIETISQTAHIHDTAETNIELKANTEHIHLTAGTDITLQVGSSKIIMRANGTITIQGVHIDIIGSDRIDLNS